MYLSWLTPHVSRSLRLKALLLTKRRLLSWALGWFAIFWIMRNNFQTQCFCFLKRQSPPNLDYSILARIFNENLCSRTISLILSDPLNILLHPQKALNGLLLRNVCIWIEALTVTKRSKRLKHKKEQHCGKIRIYSPKLLL